MYSQDNINETDNMNETESAISCRDIFKIVSWYNSLYKAAEHHINALSTSLSFVFFL